jgi:hypothetical protein
MKAKAKVEPGICNFAVLVRAIAEDSQNVTFEFKTTCDTIKEFAERISKITPINAIQSLSPTENPIMETARELLMKKGCCEACVFPAATLKVMQVATNLALPEDVSLKITKE